MDKEEDSKIEKPEISRAGLRSFFGNAEKFEVTPYGILMACTPILLFFLLMWYYW